MGDVQIAAFVQRLNTASGRMTSRRMNRRK